MSNREINLNFSDNLPTDLSKIGSLFTTCFNQSFSPELWQWKYAKSPQYAVTAWLDDRAVGHYAGVPRDVMYNGRQIRMLQITDVMVHPDERSRHGRRGVFYWLATRFLEKYVGTEKDLIQAFGFPSERHTKLGVLLKIYDRVSKIVEVNWNSVSCAPSFACKAKLLDKTADLCEPVNRLWNTMKKSLAPFYLGIRDWAYIDYRYIKHPTINYQLYLVVNRFTMRHVGLFVLRKHDNNTFELMDLVANIKDMPLLILFARNEVFKLNGTLLFSWMNDVIVSKLVSDAYIVDIEVTIPCIIWTKCIEPKELKDKWWLMSGDTDWR